MNIKDPATEPLAAEVAELTGDTGAGAAREAVRLRRDRLRRQQCVARDGAAFVRRFEVISSGDCLTYATDKIAGEPLPFLGDDFAQTDLELVKLES